jgi:hypothetical protein
MGDAFEVSVVAGKESDVVVSIVEWRGKAKSK